MSELQGLQSRISDFEAQGIQLIAISPDSVEQNRQVAEWLDLDFPILSDSMLTATDAFRLRHADAAPGGGDLPRPATYIIESGRIVWRDLTDNWRVRPRPDQLLAAIAQLES